MVFRKVVFQEIEGYNEISHIKSGDDDLLLHKLQHKQTGIFNILQTKNH